MAVHVYHLRNDPFSQTRCEEHRDELRGDPWSSLFLGVENGCVAKRLFADFDEGRGIGDFFTRFFAGMTSGVAGIGR